jgi:hypothetical protein
VAVVGSKAALLGLGAGIAIAIALIVKVVDHFHTSQKELNAQIADTSSKIGGLTSKIKELNSAKVDAKTPESLNRLEKELEVQQALLKVEEQRLVNLINKQKVPKVLEESQLASTGRLPYVTEDPTNSDNLLLDVKALTLQIQELTKKQEELGEVTEENISQYENYSKQITHLTGMESNYTLAIMEKVKWYEQVPYDSLNAEQKKYYNLLKALVYEEEEFAQAIDDTSKEEIKALEKKRILTAMEEKRLEVLKDLNDSMDKYADEISSIESDLDALASIYVDINEGEKISLATIADLVRKYPEYAKEIANINNNKEEGKRLTEILSGVEKQQTIKNLYETRALIQTQEKLLGLKRETISIDSDLMAAMGIRPEDIYKTSSAVSAIDNLIKQVGQQDFSSNVEKETKKREEARNKEKKEVKEYINELVKLQEIEHRLAMTRAEQDATGNDMREKEKLILKEIQEELERLNVIDNARLKTLKKGTSEYDSLLETVRSRSVRWWEIQVDLKDTTEEYVNVLRDLNSLEHELSVIRANREISGSENREEELMQLARIKIELDGLIETEKAQLAEMAVGTEKYDNLMSSINEKTLKRLGIEKEILSITESVNKLAQSYVKEYIDSLVSIANTEKERLQKEKEDVKNLYAEKLANLEEEYRLKQEIYDTSSKEKDEQEKIYNIEQARKKLAEAEKDRSVRQWQGDGWKWVANQKNVDAATKELEKAIESYDEFKLTQQKEADRKKLEQDKATLKELERQELEALDNSIINIDNYIKEVNESWSSAFTTQITTLDQLKEKLAEIGAEYGKFASIVSTAMSGLTSATGINVASESSVSTYVDPKGKESVSFGSTTSQQSIDYYKNLKSTYGNDQALMTQKELERTEAVIAAKKAAKEDYSLQEAYKSRLQSGLVQFRNGGVNDFTGEAMLHGSQSEPEMVLNNRQALGLFNWIKQLPTSGFGSNSTTNSNDIVIQNLNIDAKNGQHLTQLLEEAKTIVRNGFRG